MLNISKNNTSCKNPMILKIGLNGVSPEGQSCVWVQTAVGQSPALYLTQSQAHPSL